MGHSLLNLCEASPPGWSGVMINGLVRVEMQPRQFIQRFNGPTTIVLCRKSGLSVRASNYFCATYQPLWFEVVLSCFKPFGVVQTGFYLFGVVQNSLSGAHDLEQPQNNAKRCWSRRDSNPCSFELAVKGIVESTHLRWDENDTPPEASAITTRPLDREFQ